MKMKYYIPPKQDNDQKSSNKNRKKQVIIETALACLGGVIGAFSGFYGLFYLSSYIDTVNESSVNGGGITAISWIFAIITVPVGALIGGSFFLYPYRIIMNKIKP